MLTPDDATLLATGLRMTLWLTATSMALALVFGTLLGILRVSPAWPLRAFAQGYVEFFRNIPLLVVLFFVFNGLPYAGVHLDPRGADFSRSAIAGLAVYTAGYVAEVVRAGLQAVGPGQVEAARALGLGYLTILRDVLLPQAVRMIMPPMGNVLIALAKNTSIASAIAVPELMYQAQLAESRSFSGNVFLVAGLVYLVLTVPLALAVNALERRLVLRH